MNSQPHRHRLLALALAAATAIPAFAQPKPAGKTAAQAAAKSPLDSLDDSQLMSELANRGLTNLLDFYFQKNNVPDEKRKEIVVLIALKHLDSPDFAKKSAVERKKEIEDIVAGINNLLPTITDANRLLRYASALITNGTLRLVNILDYWGDNPKTQAALNPIAETVDKILERAVVESKKNADDLLAKLANANDPRVKLWEDADQTNKLAEYNRARAAYGLALSYDKANTAKRKKVADEAIAKLKEFDEEGSTVRVPVELEIAKLSMAKGAEGYKDAKEYFQKVINSKPDEGATPKQYVAEQYQARYFTIVADVLNKKADEAAKALPELKTWQETNLSNDKATQQGVQAALSMLEYRVLSARADAEVHPKEKDKINNEAVAVLMDLVGKRPDLRSIIFEQVMSKLPEKPDLATLNPLFLEALVTRGIEAIQHKTPEKDDAKNVQIAADAARQIVKSKGKPGITNEQVDSSAFRIGVFEEHISNTPQLTPEAQFQNKLDAVNAYLDYVEKYAGNKEWANDALDNSLSLLSDYRKKDANNDDMNKLYDRALDVALFKMGRAPLALAYAQRRREVGDFKSAKRGYALVKSDVPAVMVYAKYYQMFCDQQLLDHAPDAEKPVLSADVQKLADELNPLIASSLPKVDPATQKQLKQTKARMVLLAAAVARANKNPARVVEMLNGYEGLLGDFTPAAQDAMLGQALFLRVYGLMASGKNTEALAQVKDLIAKQGPERSLDTVAELLTKLDENFRAERGKENPDQATLVQLSGQRAQLAELLVEQTQKNPNLPEKNRRQYLQFNATAQSQAVELEPDPTKKKTYLDAALKTYDDLVADVAKRVDAAKTPEEKNSLEGERTVLLRLIALTQIRAGDTENLLKAHDTLAELLSSGKLGGPMIRLNENEEAKPNDIYWEAWLRFLQAKVKLAAAKADTTYMDDAKRMLKTTIIQHGEQAGGPNYKLDFKKLRTEILGDWQPATTAPVAAAATPEPAK